MNPKTESLTRQIIEIIIQLAVLLFVLGWCFQILSPFFTPIIWGVIIAIAIHPAFVSLSNKLGHRRKLSSIILTLVLLSIIILPVVLLSGSLIDGVQFLRNAIESGEAIIPPPGDRATSWPAFTKPVVD